MLRRFGLLQIALPLPLIYMIAYLACQTITGLHVHYRH